MEAILVLPGWPESQGWARYQEALSQFRAEFAMDDAVVQRILALKAAVEL
jgi:hypothetical protein